MSDAAVPRHGGLQCYIYRSFELISYLTKKGFNLLTAMALTVTLPDGYGVLCWIFTDY